MRMDDWSGILVYIEIQDTKIADVSLELIGEAVNLTKKNKSKICVVGIGKYLHEIEKQLQGYPLDSVYLYQTKEEFQADIYEEAFIDCIQKIKPAIVLIGGTAQGRALAPRAAVAFRTGLTADCTELRLDESDRLVQIRPAFGGNIMAGILTERSRPQITTVRRGIFSPIKPGYNKKNTTIHLEKLKSGKTGAVFSGKAKSEKPAGIDKQELLVAAGRGVKKKEDLEMLRELAGLLGGRLASSRALVEKGWMKPEEQIGVSGITVAPKCLLTFGISGTIQFISGMRNTGNIIAVDTNPNAHIFEIAHYPVCADLYEVVPELIRLCKK